MDHRIINSLQHPIVKKICKLKKDPSYRKEEGLIVISKDSILQELNNYFDIEILLHLTLSPLKQKIRAKEKIEVSQQVLEKCIGYSSNDTGVALISIPDTKNSYSFPWLVLDGVQDPGNIGTLLRSALAFNFKTIFLLPPCCDIYNDKALKAARGATFHLEIHTIEEDTFIDLCKQKSAPFFYADAKGQNIDNFIFPEHFVLIMGNEGHGVSETIRKKGKGISIPMNPITESLNVSIAGAILMHAATKGIYGKRT